MDRSIPGVPFSDEESILAELATAGFRVQSLADLRQSGRRYPEAVPVLLRWLPRVCDPRLEEEVVRALSVPWARPAATGPLLARFRLVDAAVDPTGLGLRWVIGNALEVLFDDAHFPEFAELATDRDFGRARQMVVLGLGKSARPEAVDVLLDLLSDSEVDGHAIMALGKLRAPAARAGLEGKLNDGRPWVRREARKALAILGPG